MVHAPVRQCLTVPSSPPVTRDAPEGKTNTRVIVRWFVGRIVWRGPRPRRVSAGGVLMTRVCPPFRNLIPSSGPSHTGDSNHTNKCQRVPFRCVRSTDGFVELRAPTFGEYVLVRQQCVGSVPTRVLEGKGKGREPGVDMTGEKVKEFARHRPRRPRGRRRVSDPSRDTFYRVY